MGLFDLIFGDKNTREAKKYEKQDAKWRQQGAKNLNKIAKATTKGGKK